MIDIVSVCAGRDLENFALCYQAALKHIEFDKFYVITNSPELFVFESESLVVIDENEIYSLDVINEIKDMKLYGFPDRAGWYLQQFLKMEFSRTKYCDKNYLIWDADTIVLKDMAFFSGNNYVFSEGKEKINMPYFKNYECLMQEKAKTKKSMISQHMIIDRNIMQELINEIEKRFLSCFPISVLGNISGDSKSLFSEYETYFNYYVSKKTNYEIVERIWFRNAAAVVGYNPNYKTLKLFFPDCEYVALEKFDTTLKGRLKGLLKFAFFLMKRLKGL